MGQELENIDGLVNVILVAKELNATGGDARMSLTVLATDGAVEIDEHADTSLTSLVDSTNDAGPSVLVNVSDGIECGTLAVVGAKHPETDRKANGVDTHSSELVEVILSDERVPVFLEDGTGVGGGTPSGGNVELSRLLARGAFEDRGSHPVLVDEPG